MQRRVSVIRIVNFIKLISSYLLSILLRKPVYWGTAAFVSVEPTTHCNLRCPECLTGQRGLTRDAGSLNLPDFSRIIEQLPPQVSYLTLYFQGEPYLNKELFHFISLARERQIYVWSSSNGHFLTEENIRKTIESGLNKLIISLDGTDQETYGKYRIGGSFETVVHGIRDFTRIRKEMNSRKPLLEIQFLVLRSNQHQIGEIKKLGKSLGADRTVLKTAQFYDLSQENPLIPEEGKWSRYKQTRGQADKRTSVLGKFMIKNSLPNRCFRMWSGCVITWDGKVVPCCFDKDAKHCLGDLKTQSFKEIWHGETYRAFRQTILKNRKSVEICRNCSQKV
ncbi:MAG: SPASM domain-containing protein [Bacteroidales bacterium]|nr:SPASM domain-containing protein [Bacteroidales bacterium]